MVGAHVGAKGSGLPLRRRAVGWIAMTLGADFPGAAMTRRDPPTTSKHQVRPRFASVYALGRATGVLAAILGDALWWYPGTGIPDSARVLRIRNHVTLSGIEWRLPALDVEVPP